MSADLSAVTDVTDDAIRALRTESTRRLTRSRRRRHAIVAAALAATVALSTVAAIEPDPPERGSWLRSVAVPAITTFADQIIASPYDNTDGRYNHTEYLTAQRQQGTTIVSLWRGQTWVAADGSSADIGSTYTVALASFRPDELLTDRWANTAPYGAERPGISGENGPDLTCPPGTVLGEHFSHTPNPGTDPASLARFAANVFATYGLRLDCRRALLRGMAAVDGPIWRGPATDLLGRTGYAIDLPAFGCTIRMIFDRTGMLLSYAESSTWTMDDHPGIYRYLILINTGRTDKPWPADQILKHPSPAPSPNPSPPGPNTAPTPASSATAVNQMDGPHA